MFDICYFYDTKLHLLSQVLNEKWKFVSRESRQRRETKWAKILSNFYSAGIWSNQLDNNKLICVKKAFLRFYSAKLCFAHWTMVYCILSLHQAKTMAWLFFCDCELRTKYRIHTVITWSNSYTALNRFPFHNQPVTFSTIISQYLTSMAGYIRFFFGSLQNLFNRGKIEWCFPSLRENLQNEKENNRVMKKREIKNEEESSRHRKQVNVNTKWYYV